MRSGKEWRNTGPAALDSSDLAAALFIMLSDGCESRLPAYACVEQYRRRSPGGAIGPWSDTLAPRATVESDRLFDAGINVRFNAH